MSDGFTLSKAALLLHCGYSFRADVETPPEPPNEKRDEAADKGTDSHDAAARFVNSKGTDVVDPKMSETWARMLRWLRMMYAPTWTAEMAYAWDPQADTARVLGVNIHRKYDEHGRKPHEIAGTCDLVSVEDDVVRVYEFATGREVEHKLEQLRTQLVVAARAHGKDRAEGHLVQFRDKEVIHHEPIVLDEFDLAALAGEYAERHASIPTAEPVAGQHCAQLYCPQIVTCPETRAAEEALVPVERVTWKMTTAIESADHAAWVLDRISMLNRAIGQLKDAVRAHLPECPACGGGSDKRTCDVCGGTGRGEAALEDGRVLHEATRLMPRFAREKAEELLRQLGATEEQIKGLTYEWPESAGLKVKKAKVRAKKSRAA